MFVGREHELELLSNQMSLGRASLIIVKGRRRIGKSRLLQEYANLFPRSYFFSGVAPSKESLDSMAQKSEFAEQFNRQFSAVLDQENWSRIFWELSCRTRDGSVLVVLDEITWMAEGDPHFLGVLKNAWDLYFSKNPRLVLVLCGSISAWIDKHVLSGTAFLGRASLVLQLKELSLRACTQFWQHQDGRHSPLELMKVLGVTGGVPRYLEAIQPTLTAEQNILSLCFSPTGILVEEFEHLCHDLFGVRYTIYRKIMERLAEGSCSRQVLLKQLSACDGSMFQDALEDLVQAGFVSRDYTWRLSDGKLSRLNHYRLQDNYSRFYLKFIRPNKGRIGLDNMRGFRVHELPGWHAMMGLQFENLVLSNRAMVKAALGLDPSDVVMDNPFFQKANQRQSGCQIDYLIQARFQTLYVCEVKFASRPLGMDVVEEVQRKIASMSVPKNFSFRPVLIHINGVQDNLLDANYFAKIIDASLWLKA